MSDTKPVLADVRYAIRFEVERIETDQEGEEERMETDCIETAGNFICYDDAVAALKKFVNFHLFNERIR